MLASTEGENARARHPGFNHEFTKETNVRCDLEV